MTQDALRVDQLAADRKRDVWLPEGLAEARSKTWESGLRENVSGLSMGEVEGLALASLHRWLRSVEATEQHIS